MKTSVTETFIVVRDDSGCYVRDFSDVEKDSFFVEVSNMICFDDCSNETVLEICFEGQFVYYRGWQPGMLMEYVDGDGEVVWGRCFPAWDH